MKHALLIVTLFFINVFALDDITITNTFVDSSVIEASDFNDNFEDVRDNINALNDSLDERFIRFTDVKDSSFQKVTTDTIRGNPEVDSIQGYPYIDSVKTSYAEITKADINGGTADGVIIGQADAEDANIDSLHARIITTDSLMQTSYIAFDSINFGTAGYIRCDTGSFPCTTSTGTYSFSGTPDTIGTAHFMKIGNLVTVNILDINLTLSSYSYLGILGFPDSLTLATGYLSVPFGGLMCGGSATIFFNNLGANTIGFTSQTGCATDEGTIWNPSFTYYLKN